MRCKCKKELKDLQTKMQSFDDNLRAITDANRGAVASFLRSLLNRLRETSCKCEIAEPLNRIHEFLKTEVISSSINKTTKYWEANIDAIYHTLSYLLLQKENSRQELKNIRQKRVYQKKGINSSDKFGYIERSTHWSTIISGM